ncbi:MAG: hypothetical protein SXQ77_00325 [Halobacteria archaeon]|nr:hypothetical protein [Halobacteria archaeon]
MSDKIVCVKYETLKQNLEIEEDSLEEIIERLVNEGFLTSVKLEGETGYCLTESGQEYTEDWLRSLDIDIENITIEHLVEMLESTAPPER